MLRRILRSFEKNRNELFGVIGRRYPPFVWSDVVPAAIPVFQFHGVSTGMLEPLLEYLYHNDYETLSADEYRGRAGSAGPARRSVLLTFDDGEESLYTVAYPLLKRLGQKAVAYVVAGRVPEAASEAGASALSDWTQLREMHDSGVIDVQSHSLYHHSVAVSPRIVDFARPGVSTSFLDSDLSPLDQSARPGYPLHAWGARMGARPAFRESPEVIEAVVNHVARHGGESFFGARGWRRALLRIVKETRLRHPAPGFETPEEQRAEILADLRGSRLTIESRLPGKAVQHYCFPWYRGSALAVSLSREAGYESNAWASLLPGFVGRSSAEPLPIARLAPRYIWRLPGNGRRSLAAVLRS